MSKVTDNDVRVVFKSNGQAYGEERFLIRLNPGEDLKDAVEEKAQESGFAVPGVNYELDIHAKEIAA